MVCPNFANGSTTCGVRDCPFHHPVVSPPQQNPFSKLSLPMQISLSPQGVLPAPLEVSVGDRVQLLERQLKEAVEQRVAHQAQTSQDKEALARALEDERARSQIQKQEYESLSVEQQRRITTLEMAQATTLTTLQQHIPGQDDIVHAAAHLSQNFTLASEAAAKGEVNREKLKRARETQERWREYSATIRTLAERTTDALLELMCNLSKGGKVTMGTESVQLVVQIIDAAQEYILMLAFTLDNPDILEALIRASHKIGVRIYIAYDGPSHAKNRARQSRGFQRLQENCEHLVMKSVTGPVIAREMNYSDPTITAPMHHKVLIVDGIYVV